jgi:hypothetical protein
VASELRRPSGCPPDHLALSLPLSEEDESLRRTFILPLVLAVSVLLAGAAIAASQGSSPSRERTDPTAKQREEFHKTRAEFQRTKKKTGDDTLVLGVWRNCKFHLVKVRAERFTATLPNGETQESVEVAQGVKAADEAAAQLPERDPACDDVEPTREQIEANRAAIEAEEAKLHPGRPVKPGP